MEDARVITMYLPQFHRVKENDEWWGEGFTEWTAVRKAEPLFKGHYQPREPQGSNYYDLLDKAAMKWQADLMHTYGVDAQCIYHYWFKDGRQILEKPAENLLSWKEIDMPFCFCWANETWARSWSQVANKNVWADTFEESKGKKGNGILLEQEYGGEQQWREHFDYLLAFFRDERYIKKDKKPIFVIYQTKSIPCFGQMMEKWQEWIVREGFPGLYIVAANCGERQKQYADIGLVLAPARALSVHRMVNRGEDDFLFEYGDIWKEILEYCHDGERYAYGGFVGYDDTPRRGKRGAVIAGASPELFRKNMSELIAKNMVCQNNLIFLNAWNEWGEGMYLEPDQCFGFQYLQGIKYAKDNYKNDLEKYQNMDSRKSMERERKRLEEKAYRYETYWRVLDRWLYLKESGRNMADYLEEKGIHSVAIYGVGMLGEHLLKELQEGNVKVCYGIDAKKDKIKAEIPIYSIYEELPETDAVIVTVPYAFEEIKERLEKKTSYLILSLESLIMDSLPNL